MAAKKIEKLLTGISKSFGKKEKRNLEKDFELFLKSTGIKYKILKYSGKIPNIPTLIAINHFTRPLYMRRTLFTTFESVISSAVVSQALKELNIRNVKWIAKSDLKEKILFSNIKIRSTQLNAIITYGLLGVDKNYPFGTKETFFKELKNGFNLAFYPEAKTGFSLEKPVPGFLKTLNHLSVQKIRYQVLPVSVYIKNGQYQIIVSSPISASLGPSLILKETMESIASNLPDSMKGYYSYLAKANTTKAFPGRHLFFHTKITAFPLKLPVKF